MAVAEQVGREAELRPHEAPKVNVAGIEETVTDKGYHSGAVVKRMKGVRDAHLHSGEETEGTAELGGQRLKNKKQCMRTGGGCGASMAKVYCGGAANWWSAASRTATRRARCGVAICADKKTF